MAGPLPYLRVATHNVRGLRSADKARDLAAYWCRARLDIVLVQETHLFFLQRDPALVREALAKGGWRSFFALASPADPYSGTAILIRSSLIANGVVEAPHAPICLAGGRACSLLIKWHGVPYLLSSVYAPADPEKRTHFLSHLLPAHYRTNLSNPAAQAARGGGHVWGGDFNFVEEPRLDRTSGRPAGRDAACTRAWRAGAWAQLVGGLRDPFRARHPRWRAYSCVSAGHRSASRIDRFYVPGRLAAPPHNVAHLPPCPWSDHAAVVLRLVCLSPLAKGPGRRIAPLKFLASPAHVDLFAEWLDAEAARAPARPDLFVSWWLALKGRIRAKCAELTRAAEEQRFEGVAEAEAQLDEYWATVNDGGDLTDELLGAALDAKRRMHAFYQVKHRTEALKARRDLVLGGERPNPGLTALVHGSTTSRLIACLQAPSGELVADGPAMAALACRAFAKVSAAPPQDAQARAEVLESVPANVFSADHVAAMGRLDISEHEVRVALRGTNPGKTPGLDGLGVAIYRRFKDTFAPLLARLFTILGSVDPDQGGAWPSAFLDGLITTILKKGDPTVVANYRPITLLNGDYKLLAKCIANRIKGPLGDVLPLNQSAFLPDRQIGDNIMLLRLLSGFFQENSTPLYMLFCDFAKAYDTIDRGFLFDVLRRMGAGDGLLRWVRLMLTGTRARAAINGFISQPERFERGVRQGDPLAPLLYLAIAFSLHSFLTARGHTIDMPRGLGTLGAPQYADDTEIPLASPDQVPLVLASLERFGLASGQRLNPIKSSLVEMGYRGPAAPALPPVVHGVPTAESAAALGFSFGARGATCDFAPLLEGVRAKLDRVHRIGAHLSTFGRGYAASSYGLSKILYHLEFCPPPRDDWLGMLGQLKVWTSRVVERRRPPVPPGPEPRAFTGLSYEGLLGAPAAGGMAVLDVESHVAARHAVRALDLVLRPDKPWARVAEAQMAARLPDLRGGAPLLALFWPPYNEGAHVGGPPTALRPFLSALSRVPLLTRSPADAGHEPGPWCYHIPLAANPLLRGGVGPLSGEGAVPGDFPERRPRGLHLFSVLHDGGVTTLGRLAAVLPHLGNLGRRELLPAWARPLDRSLEGYYFYSHANRYYRDYVPTVASFRQDLDRLLALVDAADPGWLPAAADAARAAADPWAGPAAVGPRDAVRRLLDCICFRDPFTVRGVLRPVSALTVRIATRLLAPPEVTTARRVRREAFCRLATGIPPGLALGNMAGPLHNLFQGMWRLKWDNKHKEVLWRLVHDALPLGARMGDRFTCPCGHQGAHDRLHAYWTCPVAVAVRDELLAALPADVAAPQRALPHPAWLWMAGALPVMTPQGVLVTVWRVACLAALNAMEHGRQCLAALNQRPEDLPNPIMTQIACTSSRGYFWFLLQDFASLGLMHRRDLDRLGLDHPLLCRPEGEHRCRVNRPAPAGPPDAIEAPGLDPGGGFLVHP